MSTLLKIRETINILISLSDQKEFSKYISIAEQDISVLLLEDLQNEKISAIFNIFIFSPLNQRILQLESELPSLSRSTIRDRENSLQLIESLDSFILKLLNDYSPIISTSIHHQRQVEKEIVEKEIKRDFLVKPSDYNEYLSIYELSTQHCKRILNSAYNNTLTYFTKAIKNTGGKQEIYTFITQGKAKITQLHRKIETLKKDILDLEVKKGNYNETIVNNEGVTDLNQIYLERWIHKSTIIENYMLHEQFLVEILKHLKELYSTPLEEEPQSLSKTVFGNYNYDVLTELFNALQPFIHSETKMHAFIDAFIISKSFDNQKLRFANVKLDNYADLITKMNPYFSDTIGNRKNYNQWWSDRFTFNGQNKSKDAISTMRSNSSKDANRRPDHPTVIQLVVNILKENLQ